MRKESESSPYSLSIETINVFISSKKPFSLEQVEQVILFYGGVLRIGVCYPVKECLHNLREKGFLSFSNGCYQSTEKCCLTA